MSDFRFFFARFFRTPIRITGGGPGNLAKPSGNLPPRSPHTPPKFAFLYVPQSQESQFNEASGFRGFNGSRGGLGEMDGKRDHQDRARTPKILMVLPVACWLG